MNSYLQFMEELYKNSDFRFYCDKIHRYPIFIKCDYDELKSNYNEIFNLLKVSKSEYNSDVEKLLKYITSNYREVNVYVKNDKYGVLDSTGVIMNYPLNKKIFIDKSQRIVNWDCNNLVDRTKLHYYLCKKVK